MANAGPHVWYVRGSSGSGGTIGWDAITAWSTGATIAAGILRRQLATPTVGNERAFICIIAGTTHATTEPTWVVTKGAKTTDNTVTWMECTGQPAVNGDLTNCPTWLQNKNTAVTIGMIIQNGAGTILLICTTAGTTSNSTEPTWSSTVGTINSDGATVKWTTISSSYGAYAAPHARLANALVANWAANGDTVFVANDHAETQASAIVITGGTSALPLYIYCVDKTVMPPTTVTTGASITCTGAFNFSWGNSTNTGMYVNGITASCGTGANSQTMGFGVASNSPNLLILENCGFSLPATGSTSFYSWGTNSRSAKLRFTNTTFAFAATTQIISIISSDIVWKNTPSAISGTMPTALFFASASQPGNLVCDGVDLSATTGIIWQQTAGNGGKSLFIDCKLNASATPATITQPGTNVDFVRCGSTAADYDIKSYRYEGTLQDEIAIIRTGGASDGNTPISYKIVTTANSLWVNPFEAIPITIWNNVTGSNVTVTLYGIANTAVLPANDQIWYDVEYLGSTSSPMASFASGTKANNLATGSNQTADSTSAWDSLATARANTHTYAVGDVIKVASNSGRIFFCTTGGASAGSEPGGYATAVDGGSVTDNVAVFRAGWRFSQAVVLSSPQPQIAGYIRVIVKAAIPSTTFYIDPNPILT
jgi:hypothetical protein